MTLLISETATLSQKRHAHPHSPTHLHTRSTHPHTCPTHPTRPGAGPGPEPQHRRRRPRGAVRGRRRISVARGTAAAKMWAGRVCVAWRSQRRRPRAARGRAVADGGRRALLSRRFGVWAARGAPGAPNGRAAQGARRQARAARADARRQRAGERHVRMQIPEPHLCHAHAT
eukprot:356115-Chlamydomonas_euryale.AAC.2